MQSGDVDRSPPPQSLPPGESESVSCSDLVLLFVTPDCSPPDSSVHGILQARILEWVAISSSRGSFQPRDRTQVSHIAGRFFTIWDTRGAPKRGRQVNKTNHPTLCQWQNWCRLYHHKAFLHKSSHLILTLVSEPEENLSNLPKVTQLWCNRTHYRNFTGTFVRTVKRDSEFTGVPRITVPIQGTGLMLGVLPIPLQGLKEPHTCAQPGPERQYLIPICSMNEAGISTLQLGNLRWSQEYEHRSVSCPSD